MANVWRRWYGPRLRTPAASSAGYHSRVRQLSRLMCPPRWAGNSSGVSSRGGSRSKRLLGARRERHPAPRTDGLRVGGELRRRRRAARPLRPGRCGRGRGVRWPTHSWVRSPVSAANMTSTAFTASNSATMASSSSGVNGSTSSRRGAGLRPASIGGVAGQVAPTHGGGERLPERGGVPVARPRRGGWRASAAMSSAAPSKFGERPAAERGAGGGESLLDGAAGAVADGGAVAGEEQVDRTRRT